MCQKAVVENGKTLKSVCDWYKNENMCNKAVDNYAHALEFVSECYKAQKVRGKAVDTTPPAIQFISECSKTRIQEMYDKAVDTCPFVFYSAPN